MMIRSVLAAAALLGAGAAHAQTPEISEAEARAIHDRLFTLDTHVDVPAGYASAALDPGGFTRLQVDLPKMRAGGLDAAFFIVCVGQGQLDDAGYSAARAAAEEKYQNISRMVRAYPERIALAVTADEAEAIHASGRLVALIGMENAYPLGPSLDELEMWRDRGVRYASITHFGNNQFGGSSNPNLSAGDPVEDPGLTELGRELVGALNDLGIMVDISHVGPRTSMEAIALSRAPVIASHSGVKGVYDHPRNLSDEQLRAIADNGGVAQIVAFRSYLRPADPAFLAEQSALRAGHGLDTPAGRAAASPETLARYQEALAEIRSRYDEASVSDLADHVDHAVAVAGIDHVGLVSDFDGGGGVLGWDDASETPNVTLELLRRGYSEDDLAKLWSANTLRVMRAVEAAAAR